MDASSAANQEIIWTLFALGVVVGTCGWMLYWAGLHVIGGFVGAGAGVLLAFWVVQAMGWQAHPLIVTVVGMIGGGTAGILIMRLIDYWAFFLIGVALGAPLGATALNLPWLQEEPWAQTRLALIVASVIGALAGGMLILGTRRYVIAVVAAMAGAGMIALAVPDASRFLIALMAFILSLVVQFGMIRAFLPPERMSTLSVSRGSA